MADLLCVCSASFCVGVWGFFFCTTVREGLFVPQRLITVNHGASPGEGEGRERGGKQAGLANHTKGTLQHKAKGPVAFHTPTVQ